MKNSDCVAIGVFQLYSPAASDIGCASGICFASDIALGAVCGEYNITKAAGFYIAFLKEEYHSGNAGISLEGKWDTLYNLL